VYRIGSQVLRKELECWTGITPKCLLWDLFRHSGEYIAVFCSNSYFIRLRMLRGHVQILETPHETNCSCSWNSSPWTKNRINIWARWSLEKIDIPSSFKRYFDRPIDSSYHQLTYIHCHSWYSVDARPASCDVDNDVCEPVRFANPRKNSAICILCSVHPRIHELFALRPLLRRFPARSWEDLRFHKREMHQIFHEDARQTWIRIESRLRSRNLFPRRHWSQ
jgi:hypothetical protein